MYQSLSEDLVRDRIARIMREADETRLTRASRDHEPPELPPVRMPRLIVGRLVEALRHLATAVAAA